jgi:spore germination protein YaaH
VRRRAALAALVGCCICAAPAPAQARGHGPRVFAFYSRAGGAELAHLRKVARRIDVLAPNWYAVDLETGAVNDRAPDPEIARLARRRHFAVWPVVNAHTDGEALLASATARRRVVAAVADTAARHRYAGVTLDLEGLLASQRGDYSALVSELAQRLHRSGRRLAVYVPRPPLGDLPADPPLGGRPPDGSAAAYDWPALAHAADLVLASSYNEHWAGSGPGPITTTGGFESVLARAAATSRRKVVPVLGAFGYDWPRAGGTGRLVSTLDAAAHAARVSARVSRSDGAASYAYGDRVVWYQTAGGLRLRAALARRAHMRWIGLFSLGREPLSFWG